jgi:hypothetical protein
MIWTFQQVVMEMEVSEGEVTRWIEQSWVLPVEEDGKLLFDDIDRARIQLIAAPRPGGQRRGHPGGAAAARPGLRPAPHPRRAAAGNPGLVGGLAVRRTLDELRLGIQGLSEASRAELEAILAQTRKPS